MGTKLTANRANALKSTGPKTLAGKAKSRRNALRHGILAREALILTGAGSEEEKAFRTLLAALKADVTPSGALEDLLVEKLAMITWRWRRVLRYEIGSIRETADEAVEDWERGQVKTYRDELKIHLMTAGTASLIEDPFLRGLVHPEPERWEHTEDLEMFLENEENMFAALEQPNPLANLDDWGLDVIAEEAAKAGLNVDSLLGLEEEGDWQYCDLTTIPLRRLARLFKALCQKWGMKSEAAWARLRNRVGHERDELKKKLGRRYRAQQRVRMLAALPKEADLEKIMRYEAHLAREFARTLEQLERLKGYRLALASFGKMAVLDQEKGELMNGPILNDQDKDGIDTTT